MRQAILAAAMTCLAEGGEASVRVSDVARRADVAVSLIYYHFGDRDGMVAAAQLERFRADFGSDLALLEGAAGAPSIAAAVGMIEALTREIAGASRAVRRLGRVAIIGAAYGRSELGRDLGGVSHDMGRRFALLLERFAEEGFITSGIDPGAMAAFLRAYAFGLVLNDIDPEPAPPEALVRVVLTALLGLAGPKLRGPLEARIAVLDVAPPARPDR